MGCGSSQIKSTGKQFDSRKSTTGCEDFVSFSEAVQYIRKELKMSEERATQLVLSLSGQRENQAQSALIVQLTSRIKHVLDEVEPLFAEYDPDKTGFVESQHALDILSSCFEDMSPLHLKLMIERYDTDNLDKIDFREFMLFFACIQAKKDELGKIFRDLDPDKNGELDREEVLSVLVTQCALTTHEASAVIDSFDLDQNSRFDKTELGTMWTQLFH